MGLLSFVKNAGAKIFGKDDEKEIQRQAEAQADAAKVEQMRETLRRRRFEANLQKQLDGLGFEIENGRIEYDGETVTLRGKVDSQEMREKIVLVAGNVEGVSAVDDRLEVANPQPEATFYTVKSGDTLSKIAKQYYGNASKYPVIFEANRPMLKDPDKIYPGQVLRIPSQ